MNNKKAGVFPINDLYLFPIFNNRDEYFEATGEEAPEWDRNRPVKSWFDPAARITKNRTMLYDVVLMYDKNGMVIPDGKGAPQVEQLGLLREDAATVNLLPRERMVDYGPGSKVAPIPVPMRPLKEYESLIYTFGGLVALQVSSLIEVTPKDDVIIFEESITQPTKSLWEILVPTVSNKGKPFRTRFHRVWDKEVRSISGGLTIMPVSKGQWVHYNELFEERMIPVRILAIRAEIEKIIDFTIKYYEQEAVLAYKLSDETILRHKNECKK